jgi:predicted RNase H-like HicB family nuclease
MSGEQVDEALLWLALGVFGVQALLAAAAMVGAAWRAWHATPPLKVPPKLPPPKPDEVAGRAARWEPRPELRFARYVVYPRAAVEVALELDDDSGGYIARAAALPGCFAQGDTLEEALANVREAAELCLEDEGEQRATAVELVTLLRRYEKQFGMSTAEFMKRYREMPDNDSFEALDWHVIALSLGYGSEASDE